MVGLRGFWKDERYNRGRSNPSFPWRTALEDHETLPDITPMLLTREQPVLRAREFAYPSIRERQKWDATPSLSASI